MELLFKIIERRHQFIEQKCTNHSPGVFSSLHFPCSGVGANIVVTLMSCMIILPIIYIYDMPITVHMIWIPVGVLMAGFMALGLGMMMAPLNCVNGDVEHLIRFITRAGFFVSPVMWTAEMALERGAWGEAALWNPMVVPITMVRHGLEGKAVDFPTASSWQAFLSPSHSISLAPWCFQGTNEGR